MTPNLSEKSLLGEKAALPFTQSTQRRSHIVNKMPSARHCFLTLLLGLLVTAGLANALLKQQPANEDRAESESDDVVHRDDSTFSRLLSSASPQALHQFLHAYFPSTYKHGVYDSDHAAMEAVHANDPELATSIVQMAKRQQSSSGNDTTAAVTTSTSTETSAATSTSESSTSQESTAETTSAAPSSTSTLDTTTTTATPSSTTQTDSQTTTTTSESTETTSTSGTFTSSSADLTSETTTVVTTTLSSSTPLIVTTSVSSSSSSSSSRDSTLATTTTSSAGTTTSPRTSTFTSTLPGGAKTTITSVEVVTPGATEAASTTSGTSGSLQSGAGRSLVIKPVAEVVIGVIVGGALLV
ncbi:uncharacterized protein F4807DRAFT_414 [Annulohypoxylon truncatum]|uniref:uncharacterized protein n=1 Tax=Annulohypoxylon truncatum TaxID=327061 RepID=UPI0020076E39|nr:uncharacterized protein F4807DRAFT_414 [Annulohypoxylon truncatum]KAI1214514.1 hypothetical protein F4807DRAFT_414 [Annulohypoxylon truncatum]